MGGGTSSDGIDADPLAGRDLAAFVAAVEAATVHGAAETLCLTQSAVSKRIQALERRLGVRLLQRTGAGVSPTRAGRLLYPEAKQALAALRRAAQVTADGGAAQRTLHLVASHTIGEFLLPGWLAAFRGSGGREAKDDLHVQVDVVNSPGVLAKLESGSVDMGFVESDMSLTGLTSFTLMRDELVVAVAPDHRWARYPVLAPQELTTEPYYARERESGLRSLTAARLARHDVDVVPALETPSIQALKRAVLAGGYTIISEIGVRAEVDAGVLCTLRVRDVDLTRELRAVHLTSRPLRGPTQDLWDWLWTQRRVSGAAAS